MTSLHRAAVIALTAIIAAGIILPMTGLRADNPPASQPAARPAREIIPELEATSAQLQAAMPLPDFLDPTVRQTKIAKALPLLHKMADLLGQLRDTQPDPDAKLDLTGQQYQYYAMLITANDEPTATLLHNQAAGNDATAIPAQSALALGNWWKNTKSPADQLKVLTDYTPTIKAHPADTSIVATLDTMLHVGVANHDVAKKIVELVKTNMKGDAAQTLVDSAEAQQALFDMVGKPLTLTGRTSTGGKFSSDSLQGKVILVDFWATWCTDCLSTLPQTKKLYDDFHPKGLEIVGVDCDSQDDTVNDFTKQKQMPWTQLRETSQSGEDQWNPLAKQLHVTQLPTIFLIDKKGILRYVDAVDGTESKVAALVAEGGTSDGQSAPK